MVMYLPFRPDSGLLQGVCSGGVSGVEWCLGQGLGACLGDRLRQHPHQGPHVCLFAGCLVGQAVGGRLGWRVGRLVGGVVRQGGHLPPGPPHGAVPRSAVRLPRCLHGDLYACQRNRSMSGRSVRLPLPLSACTVSRLTARANVSQCSGKESRKPACWTCSGTEGRLLRWTPGWFGQWVVCLEGGGTLCQVYGLTVSGCRCRGGCWSGRMGSRGRVSWRGSWRGCQPRSRSAELRGGVLGGLVPGLRGWWADSQVGRLDGCVRVGGVRCGGVDVRGCRGTGGNGRVWVKVRGSLRGGWSGRRTRCATGG